MSATSNKNWTAEDVPDLTGQVIIVTGANSGIGFETAKELTRSGAETILACRSLTRAQAAQRALREEIPDAQAPVMELDLASLTSIRRFAERFGRTYHRLHVLVNNAGIMMVPYGVTEDGFESQFGTNHLGHFALTGLVLEVLLGTPGARVVNVSSNAHRMGNMDFENLMYEEGGYSPFRAYGRSKLANLLFTYELQRRFEAASANALALAAHPGTSSTNLGRHLAKLWYARLLSPIVDRATQSAAMGALPILRAAVDPEALGGQYFGPAGFMGQRGYPVRVSSTNASRDAADALRLWRLSEQLTGVSYTSLENAPHEPEQASPAEGF